MIEDEIKRQQGEEVIVEDSDATSLINVTTHISDEYVSDEDIKIEIHQKINEIDSYDKLLEIKDELESSGYEVNCVGRAHLPHSQIIGHNAAVTSDFVGWLKKQIPEVKSSQFVYDPVRMYCVHSDFTIIVSGS